MRWQALVMSLAALGLVGCGTAAKPTVARPVLPKPASLKLGPVVLQTGGVWMLNNPNGGTPHESLSIEKIQGTRIEAVVYLGEFGSLVDATLHGNDQGTKALTLSGTIEESTITGGTQSRPIQLLLQPVSPHTLWITQTIPGDSVDSFSQISFKESSNNNQ